MPTFTARTTKCIIAFDSALDLLTKQLTPVHLRLSHLFDHTCYTSRHITSTSSTCCLDHSFFDLVFDLIKFCFGVTRTTAAFAVAFFFAVAFHIKVFVKHLAKLLHILFTVLLSLFKQLIIDFFGSPAAVFKILIAIYNFGFFTNTIVNKQVVNNVVSSNVVEHRISAVTTTKVIIYHVQDFVCNNKLNFFIVHCIKELGVKVQFTSVNCGSH